VGVAVTEIVLEDEIVAVIDGVMELVVETDEVTLVEADTEMEGLVELR